MYLHAGSRPAQPGRVLFGESGRAGSVPEQPSRAYNYLVRVKTSITLPADLLERVDRIDSNRSAFLERAALATFRRKIHGLTPLNS